MAKELTITLSQEEFPNVIATYGDNAAQVALQMSQKMGIEPTKINLESILMNLESDLEDQRLLSGYDPDEEYPDAD